MADANLVARVGSACMFVPAVLALLRIGDWAILLLVLAIIGRCSWELFHLAQTAGRGAAGWVGIFLALLPGLHAYAFGTAGLLELVLVMGMICLVTALRMGPEDFLSRAITGLGAVIFLGLMGCTPLLIVHGFGPERETEASYLLIVVLLGVWLSDSAAYFSGRFWGRRKLAPSISPGKTIVGFVGGVIGGLVPAALYSFTPSVAPQHLLGLLLLTGLAGQLGDLTESAIKRDLGAKDAPQLIPGHGGALDRFDSYFFAFPTAYLILIALGTFR